MGEHETWFHLIPGVREAEHSLRHALGEKSLFFGNDLHGLPHVIMGIFAAFLCVVLALRYRAHVQKAGDGGLIPERRFNARSVVETICEACLGMMTGVMGPKAARQFLPLIGSLAFFILISNLLGLVPGFLPATDATSTNVGMALVVFGATHYYGIKVNGMAHIKHLFGPVWWLAPLMFLIEVVSHLARPLSLTLRLAGNMIGDHKVLSLFLGLIPLIVPMPIMVLGIIVCVVQALVFCLLSVVYIGLAIEEHEHEH
ncbi:MAG: F0F1 ATP synthase subunit A, partial [Myxococcales bacterium]|nr:F0F1 ATP synthase subunit A [Myxococcales bacterium]